MNSLHDYIRMILAEAQPGMPQSAEDLVQQATGRVPDDEEKEAERETLERDDEIAVDDPRLKGKAAILVNKTGNMATVRDPDTGRPVTVRLDKVMLVRKAADARKFAQQSKILQRRNQKVPLAGKAKAPGVPKAKTTIKPTGPTATAESQAAVGRAVLDRMRRLAGIPPSA